MLDTAIDELLRYDSPVQLDGRYLLEDVEIGGKQLRAGAQVVAAVGAANHDPAAFSNPGKLDVGRKEKSHISFGRGDSLLPWCATGPAGGAHRIRSYFEEVQHDTTVGRAGSTDRRSFCAASRRCGSRWKGQLNCRRTPLSKLKL